MVVGYKAPSGGGTMGITGGPAWSGVTGDIEGAPDSGWKGSVLETMRAANPGGFPGLQAMMAGQGTGVPYPTPTAIPGAESGQRIPEYIREQRRQRDAAAEQRSQLPPMQSREEAFGSGRSSGGGGGGGGGGGAQIAADASKYAADVAARTAAGGLALQSRQYEEGKAASAEAAGFFPRLVDSYNVAYGEAKSANEARYQAMLGVVDETTGQREADIRSSYTMQQADAMQRLQRVGMANTTVAPTMKMGYQREQQSALNRLADQMQGTRLGIMERKVDAYPDASLLASLSSAIMGQGPGGTAGTVKALSGLRLS